MFIISEENGCPHPHGKHYESFFKLAWENARGERLEIGAQRMRWLDLHILPLDHQVSDNS